MNIKYRIENEGEGCVVAWGEGRTKPQSKGLAEALASAMNNQPTQITLIALKSCCEQEFLHTDQVRI